MHEPYPELVYNLWTAVAVTPFAAIATRRARSMRVKLSRAYRRRYEHHSARALIAALDARDHYTGEHSEAVVELSLKVARRMGIPPEVIQEVGQVALLHDIGKLGIPDSILNKRGPLDEEEWRIMKQHPVIGERIALSTATLRHLAPALRAEHERWDGNGYPDGLRGRAIPLASRIILACDAYHAMVSNRPYRAGMAQSEALAEIAANAGSQFCPETCRALIDVLLEEAEMSVASSATSRPAPSDAGPSP